MIWKCVQNKRIILIWFSDTPLYALVQFDDDMVSYVPSSWIFQNYTKCYWPKKKFNNFREILKEPDDTWLVYSIIKFFGHAGKPQKLINQY